MWVSPRGSGTAFAAARCRLTRGIAGRRRSRPRRSARRCRPMRRSRAVTRRDGFWIHRYLTGVGVENLVVDSSSLEVNRRARRAKTDVIDLEKLLSMLRRHLSGEKKVWHVVHIPSDQDEARRQPHRDLWTMKRDRTRVTNR